MLHKLIILLDLNVHTLRVFYLFKTTIQFKTHVLNTCS